MVVSYKIFTNNYFDMLYVCLNLHVLQFTYITAIIDQGNLDPVFTCIFMPGHYTLKIYAYYSEETNCSDLKLMLAADTTVLCGSLNLCWLQNWGYSGTHEVI